LQSLQYANMWPGFRRGYRYLSSGSGVTRLSLGVGAPASSSPAFSSWKALAFLRSPRTSRHVVRRCVGPVIGHTARIRRRGNLALGRRLSRDFAGGSCETEAGGVSCDSQFRNRLLGSDLPKGPGRVASGRGNPLYGLILLDRNILIALAQIFVGYPPMSVSFRVIWCHFVFSAVPQRPGQES
jgi:hypothetical protein